MTDATAPTADVTGGSPQDPYYSGSTLFHMQIANPVSGGTPSYDGFWTLAFPTVTNPVASATAIKYEHDDNATGTTTNRNTKPYDLMPASDYDLTLDTTDTTTPCQSGSDQTAS